MCSVAVDHFIAYHAGIPEGLANLPRVIGAVVAGAPDAITMTKGAALSCWPAHAGRIPLIMQSTLARADDSADEQLASPEDAVRIGADAFAICSYVRGATEAAHIRRVAAAVRDAGHWDMPVIVHTYPRRFTAEGVEISFRAEDIAWAVRCAIEAGVDIVKVPYCGDVASYAQIVASCPVPVVAAGGPQAGALESALAMAAEVVASGARGMTVGRNIWGFADATRAVEAFKAVIHQGAGPAAAGPDRSPDCG
jgi:DhnA family fructose-bisphosphate aldolase class Ia